ncbi:MAG: hypothetical protein JW739_08960 [Opitutales bacterium]|nr:hypothetical protein [Opitutales bacterium]
MNYVAQLEAEHNQCIFCGSENPHGLQLKFNTTEKGVYSEFVLDKRFQGYAGIAQGGIVAGVLDCAMTHCLFKMKVRALTARLNVRYRHEVPIEQELNVSAGLSETVHDCYVLKAKLCRGRKVLATAEGFFMPVEAKEPLT